MAPAQSPSAAARDRAGPVTTWANQYTVGGGRNKSGLPLLRAGSGAAAAAAAVGADATRESSAGASAAV